MAFYKNSVLYVKFAPGQGDLCTIVGRTDHQTENQIKPAYVIKKLTIFLVLMIAYNKT